MISNARSYLAFVVIVVTCISSSTFCVYVIICTLCIFVFICVQLPDNKLADKDDDEMKTLLIFVDRISEGSNAIASVRLFVCPSVSLFPLYLRKQVTVELELLHVSSS